MMKLFATIVAVVLFHASPTLAGGLKLVASSDAPARTMGPSLSSSEIAALQYHEDAAPGHQRQSFRCQTRAGIFNVYPQRPIDTSCAVDGLPGFMLP